MSTNYVLIDLENVWPKNLEFLAGHPFKVLVFVGANHSKGNAKALSALKSAMQKLGVNAKYIKITGNGPNALDFHITCYLGELLNQYPKAHFHIISKDTGFDPLVKHLKARSFRVQREKDLAEIPVLHMSSYTSDDEKIAAIVKNLTVRGKSRPRKIKTLANTINAIFAKKIKESELLFIIEELQRRKYIVVSDSNVSYKLPLTC